MVTIKEIAAAVGVSSATERELTDPYYVALRLGIERRCAMLKTEQPVWKRQA